MISKFIDEAVTLNNLPASPAICWHWTLYQTITFEVSDWGREKIKKKLNNLLNDCQSWQIYVTVIHLEVRTSHALAPKAWESSKVCRYVGYSLSVTGFIRWIFILISSSSSSSSSSDLYPYSRQSDKCNLDKG